MDIRQLPPLRLDEIPGLVLTLWPDGQVEFINRRTLEFYGQPATSFRTWLDFVHPDDRERVTGSWAECLSMGKPLEIEARARHASGSYRWLHARIEPIRDDTARLIRWCCLLTDIEDQKRAENALRANAHHWRLIVDGIPGLICTNTPDGEVELVNETLLNYTGKPLEELRQWAVVVHAEDLPEVARRWQTSIQTELPFDVEVRVRRADGLYRWFHCRGLPVYDGGGCVQRWCNLLTDIEDRKAAEGQLRAREKELARATQIATVGELSAAIAHEINQPLAAIVNNGHACRGWLNAAPPNVERALLSLERIIRDGKAAAEVIQRIRALYRQAPPSKELLNVNDVIEEVCHLISGELRRKSIALSTELQRTIPPTKADRVQLQQVISNLTRNAVEAMEPPAAGPRDLRIVSLREADRIVVQVGDTGVGVADTRGIFEPFFTTKPNGMGMGLAICRSIIEAHGGELWAARAASVGSIVSFALPIALDA
jgi:PAS domain S-box-containing protein